MPYTCVMLKSSIKSSKTKPQDYENLTWNDGGCVQSDLHFKFSQGLPKKKKIFRYTKSNPRIQTKNDEREKKMFSHVDEVCMRLLHYIPRVSRLLTLAFIKQKRTVYRTARRAECECVPVFNVNPKIIMGLKSK